MAKDSNKRNEVGAVMVAEGFKDDTNFEILEGSVIYILDYYPSLRYGGTKVVFFMFGSSAVRTALFEKAEDINQVPMFEIEDPMDYIFMDWTDWI